MGRYAKYPPLFISRSKKILHNEIAERENIFQKLIPVVRDLNSIALSEKTWECVVLSDSGEGVVEHEYKVDVTTHTLIVRKIRDTTLLKVYLDIEDVPEEHRSDIIRFVNQKFEPYIKEKLEKHEWKELNSIDAEKYIELTKKEYLTPLETFHLAMYEKYFCGVVYKEEQTILKTKQGFLQWIILKLQTIFSLMRRLR